MKQYAPIRLVLQMPRTEASKKHLGRLTAAFHGDWVCRTLQQLPCSPQEKQRLLEAVIRQVKEAAP